ncbi:cutinase [Flammula alnicola]|nr:cutinase [Flammula alnicola]
MLREWKLTDPCENVTVIFARGTNETSLVGSVIGPQFDLALQSALGSKSFTFQGVDYPASEAGFLEGGNTQDALTMANAVNSLASLCPDTAIVMSGYDQGAQLVHLATAMLSPSVQNHVKAIVVFGDPDSGEAFPAALNSLSISFCTQGDQICTGSKVVTPSHFDYALDANAAAIFVAGKV